MRWQSPRRATVRQIPLDKKPTLASDARVSKKEDRKKAAAILGSVKSDAKAAAAKENGRKPKRKFVPKMFHIGGNPVVS